MGYKIENYLFLLNFFEEFFRLFKFWKRVFLIKKNWNHYFSLNFLTPIWRQFYVLENDSCRNCVNFMHKNLGKLVSRANTLFSKHHHKFYVRKSPPKLMWILQISTLLTMSKYFICLHVLYCMKISRHETFVASRNLNKAGPKNCVLKTAN